MPFPIKVTAPDRRGLEAVDRLLLRSQILPIFTIDPADATKRPQGYGTCFRIDPWGSCATAFHVVHDMLDVQGERLVLRTGVPLPVALDFPYHVYGKVRIPDDAWRPLSGLLATYSVEHPPLQPPRIRNMTELASIRVMRRPKDSETIHFLPLDLGGWRPRVGEIVMAFGYADLDLDHNDEGENRPLVQQLYASQAKITEVQPPDLSTGRPWPLFRVEATWPGGMSGGPVFNEDGFVVGIVSTGMVGDNSATAVSFCGWSPPRHTFPTVDPRQPGHTLGWLAFNLDNKPIGIAFNRRDLEHLIDGGQAARLEQGSYSLWTGDYE